MLWTIPNPNLHDKAVRLTNKRTVGRTRVFVYCGNPDCHHNAEIDASGFPDDLTLEIRTPKCFAPCAIIAALTSARRGTVADALVLPLRGPDHPPRWQNVINA